MVAQTLQQPCSSVSFDLHTPPTVIYLATTVGVVGGSIQ